MTVARILPLAQAQFSYQPWAWPFALQRRAEIDTHFAARRLRTPEIWNGRALLLRTCAFEGASLRGTFFETDYASLLAWRDWGFPEAGAINCFAMGAIRTSDGAYLLGVMGAHTANAGRIYFPAGTPEPEDIVGGRVDLDGNVIREVAEETGLRPEDLTVEPEWTAVTIGPRIALIKRMHARGRAAEMRQRIRAHLQAEQKPELHDIRVVAGRADFDPNMPSFVTAFLEHEWPE
jgi:8-oxo-dGTP pyrophosphatase MutT (NUDIX family)